MHFEILVEDRSGKAALDILIPKIINANHSFKVRAYKGVGRIPKNLKSSTDAHSCLENEIDEIVYSLYNLTSAEVAIVEAESWVQILSDQKLQFMTGCRWDGRWVCGNCFFECIGAPTPLTMLRDFLDGSFDCLFCDLNICE